MTQKKPIKRKMARGLTSEQKIDQLAAWLKAGWQHKCDLQYNTVNR